MSIFLLHCSFSLKTVCVVKCHFYLKMNHSMFGGQALPEPAGGAYNASLDPLAGLTGRTTRNGRDGKEKSGTDMEGKGAGKERRGRLNSFHCTTGVCRWSL